MFKESSKRLPGRNEVCWCGSGRKYKKCHLPADRMKRAEERAAAPARPRSSVRVKTPEQVEGIRAAGAVTTEILDWLEDRVIAGVTTEQIDDWVRAMMEERGAVPATLGYRGFPKSCCTSINEVVCHGIPEPRPLVDGDIVNIDVTSVLNGFYGDASRMYLVGDVDFEAERLSQVTRECLARGVAAVRPGGHLGDIGAAIQEHAEAAGFSVVRAFVGHGTGVRFHEDPQVPHFGRRGHGERIIEGSVFTIEPMINAGHWDVKMLPDGWTVLTADGSLSAQWEHTLYVGSEGAEILAR